jgi:hypothetical protein
MLNTSVVNNNGLQRMLQRRPGAVAMTTAEEIVNYSGTLYQRFEKVVAKLYITR